MEDPGKSSSSAAVSTNYQNLPHHLKSCLDFCSTRFHESRKSLVRLLLGVGLVQEKPGEFMEDTAANVIQELIDLGMFRESEFSLIDGTKCIEVQDPYDELSILEAEEQDFISKPADSPIHAEISRHGGNESPLDFKGLPVHSLFLFDSGSLTPANLRTVCGLQFLSVLELRSQVDNLPDQVGDLVHLRYLSLGLSGLKELPGTVGNLLKLQTLDIKLFRKQFKLPVEVLRIQNLRHLLNSSTIIWFINKELRVPCGIGRMVNLHTLCGVYAGGGIARELGALIQLREFGANRVAEDHVTELLEAIMKMENLVSLFLRAEVTFFRGTQFMLFPALEPFSPPPLLQELHLNGGLIEIPNWFTSMENLTILKLSRSNLSENPTLVLQFLPKLKHLTLQEAYTAKLVGKEFCGAGGFPRLEILYIESKLLVGWTEIVKGAFPSLRGLEFRDCMNLRLFPEGLQNVTTLRTLRFWGIHTNQDLIRRLKGEENYKIKHIPKFRFPK